MSRAAFLATCAALVFGAFAVCEPVATIATGIVIASIQARVLGARSLLVITAAFALSALRAGHSVERYERERARVQAAFPAPARCSARATVLTSPTSLQGSASYVAELTNITCDERAVPGPIWARLSSEPRELARGDVLAVIVQIAPVQLFRNVGLPDPVLRAARTGIVASGRVLDAQLERPGAGFGALVDRARAHARRRIEATFSPLAAPMARALVLGENDLDAGDQLAFKASGLSHMLAVSGTHLVFAVVSLVSALRFILVRITRFSVAYDVRRVAAALGGVLALVYADFAGGGGSAWRAAWMLCAALFVRACGRKPCGVRALGASLAAGASIDPLCAFDVSFLLSAAATSGLLWIGQPLARRCTNIGVGPVRYVALGVVATLSAMLPCAPLLALLGSELTAFGVVANLVAAPFGELVALPVCLAHSLLTAWPALEQGAAWVGSGALLVVRATAHASARAHWLAIPVPPPTTWQFAVLAIAAATWASACRRVRVVSAAAAMLALSVLEHTARVQGAPEGVLRVTALDVGQGDATLIDLPDGKLMLIDAGGFVGSPVDPGQSVILPMLRARRRPRLDIVVLTHPHPDHFGGLGAVVRGVAVGEFWDTGQSEREGAGPVYAALVSELRERGIPVRRPAELCVEPRAFAGARLDVLAPCPSFEPGLGANDNSFVLSVRYAGRRALFMGDAEAHEEAELVARHGKNLRADFLKVGHHGSRTSTSPEFLALVAPRVASISCGLRNRFGHPHAVTLTKLRARGVLGLRLDRLGSVLWQTTGEEPSIRVFDARALTMAEGAGTRAE